MPVEFWLTLPPALRHWHLSASAGTFSLTMYSAPATSWSVTIISSFLINNNNNGISWSDRKRPDGLSLVPWEAGKPLTWDVTVACSLADSHVATSAREACSKSEGKLLVSLRNTQTLTPTTSSSPSPLSNQVLLTHLVVIFYSNLVASFPLSQVMTERRAFCFSNSPFSFSVFFYFTTRYFCEGGGVVRTFQLSSFFLSIFFFPGNEVPGSK